MQGSSDFPAECRRLSCKRSDLRDHASIPLRMSHCIVRVVVTRIFFEELHPEVPCPSIVRQIGSQVPPIPTCETESIDVTGGHIPDICVQVDIAGPKVDRILAEEPRQAGVVVARPVVVEARQAVVAALLPQVVLFDSAELTCVEQRQHDPEDYAPDEHSESAKSCHVGCSFCPATEVRHLRSEERR